MGKNKNKDLEIKLQWQEYRNAVCENQTKSQDDFEKYINLIASGGLGLTITFIDKIVPIKDAICIWIITLGWILLAITLLTNLLSHHISAKFSAKVIQNIDDENYESIFNNSEQNNKIINRYNNTSIYSLFGGIIAIILFVTINIYNMSDKKTNNNPNKNLPKPLTEERGRIIPPPPKVKTNINPKK